jgi:hypothetical protein
MRTISKRITFAACACLGLTATVTAAQLPCVKPGTERWPVKIALPSGAKTQTMTLTDALNLPRLDSVKKNDPRYQDTRIMDQLVKEDTLVTISGYLYLVAFESDDCDFHISDQSEAADLGGHKRGQLHDRGGSLRGIRDDHLRPGGRCTPVGDR